MERTLPRSLAERWAFAIAFSLVAGIGISQVLLALADWRLDDWAIYRAAADRILAGQPLYAAGDALHAYRYAPWLAYLAIPFSGSVWSLLMLAGSAAALVPLAREWRRPESAFLLAVFAPLLFYVSASGNVQGLMLAGIVWTLRTRWAFLGIGLAASLKITPILYALVLVAERRWLQAAGSLAVAGVLWLPVLWMGVQAATFDSGAARLLPVPVWAAVTVAALGVATWAAAARSPLTPLAAGTAAVLALPRLFLYDATLLLPAALRAGGVHSASR